MTVPHFRWNTCARLHQILINIAIQTSAPNKKQWLGKDKNPQCKIQRTCMKSSMLTKT